MEEESVNAYLETKNGYFPPEYYPSIRSHLIENTNIRVSDLMNLNLKNPTTLLVASIFGGELGIDRFLLNDSGAGVGKLLTGGGLGVWWLVDIFKIQDDTRRYNYQQIMSL